MSRSKRKPYYKDKSKIHQKLSARKARRNKTDTDPKTLRNQVNSWSVSDYSFYCPNDEKAGRK